MGLINKFKEIIVESNKILSDKDPARKISSLLRKIILVVVSLICLFEVFELRKMLSFDIFIIFPIKLSSFLEEYSVVIYVLFIIYCKILRKIGLYLVIKINKFPEYSYMPFCYTIDDIIEMGVYSVLTLKAMYDLLLCIEQVNVIDCNKILYILVISDMLLRFIYKVYIHNSNIDYLNKISYTPYFDTCGKRIAKGDKVVYKNRLCEIFNSENEWYLADINAKFMDTGIKLKDAIEDEKGNLKVHYYTMGMRME